MSLLNRARSVWFAAALAFSALAAAPPAEASYAARAQASGNVNVIAMGQLLDEVRVVLAGDPEFDDIFALLDLIPDPLLFELLDELQPDDAVLGSELGEVTDETFSDLSEGGFEALEDGTGDVAAFALMPISPGHKLRPRGGIFAQGSAAAAKLGPKISSFFALRYAEGETRGLSSDEEGLFETRAVVLGVSLSEGAWTFGTSAGYAWGKTRSRDGTRRSSTGAQNFNAFLAWREGNWRLQGQIAATRTQYDNERAVLVAPPVELIFGRTSGTQISGGVSASYNYRFSNGLNLRAGAGFDLSHGEIRGYSETGGASALDVDERSSRRAVARFGLAAQHSFTIGGTKLTLSANGDVVHDFVKGGEVITIAFDDAATITVDLRIGDRDQDWFETGAGLSVSLAPGLDAALDFQTSFGRSDVDFRSGRLRVSYSW